MEQSSPKVSVIIHFLNSAKYLSQAVHSVFRQTFTNWELVLVDGGSKDGSTEIATEFEKHSPNKIKLFVHIGPEPLGIFSSRIWGAQNANAEVLALLDSDDEWHPQFLERHFSIYQKIFNGNPGMVYCPSVYWWEDTDNAHNTFVQPIPAPGLHNPPGLVLEFIDDEYAKSPCNSSVMVSREIIKEAAGLIGIASEKMGDDQFLWSHIAFQYPIYVSPEPQTRYRQWGNSTCAIGFATGEYEKTRNLHLTWLLNHILNSYSGPKKTVMAKVVSSYLGAQSKSLSSSESPLMNINNQFKKSFVDRPKAIRKFFSNLNRISSPADIKVFRRQIPKLFNLIMSRIKLTMNLNPLSEFWGADRGLPTHRYYLEQFVQEFSSDIKGHCLEFQDDTYTTRFGGSAVTKLDILHIDDSNPDASLIADLTKPNEIPGNTYDCIICTHVLHVIFELDAAIKDLFRILKPGGVLLVAVPHVSMCDPSYHELWRFTPEGLKVLLEKPFETGKLTIRAYGNSLIAAGEIRGLVSHEFTKKELEYNDQRFAVEVCARAQK